MKTVETGTRYRFLAWRPSNVGVCLSAVLVMTITAGGLAGFRINLTPSEPLGIWRIRPLARPAAVGDLVFVCPPAIATMKSARQRGYLRSGLCPGGYSPLIKTIVATAGQRVRVGRSVSIDGAALPHSNVSARDGQGRPMEVFRGGEVGADEVFLHSGFAASFDSRYFGPVPVSGVLGLAEEVLTYAP